MIDENVEERSVSVMIGNDKELSFVFDHVPNSITVKEFLRHIISLDQIRKEIDYSICLSHNGIILSENDILNVDSVSIIPAPPARPTHFSSYLTLYFVIIHIVTVALLCLYLIKILLTTLATILIFYLCLILIYSLLISSSSFTFEQYQILKPSGHIYELVYWFFRALLPDFHLEDVIINH